MEIKGSAVMSTREFVKEKFGDSKFKEWQDVLPEESKRIFSNAILPNSWFEIKNSLEIPTKKVCDFFYEGDLKGARELGKFSADHGLKGVYRFFVKIGSPQFIIKKAASILPTYYKPSIMKIDKAGDGVAVVHITKFEGITEIIEHRIGGWMEKAMEISGGNNVEINISKSLTKGDGYTEYELTWD